MGKMFNSVIIIIVIMICLSSCGKIFGYDEKDERPAKMEKMLDSGEGDEKPVDKG
ncbi:hypothetical protein IFO69_10695 [Echinicola sp. CAU 1574]|uniref:Lipoprotein n=1 Tax=Echinicola arenosa TaxID=2774144 RepID=A0ABR9AMX3_9BACT|nr:hypothetical protein [Echinicola arenosa]MBD8489213.1 hypothetical protein [Echinicola arenosa]